MQPTHLALLFCLNRKVDVCYLSVELDFVNVFLSTWLVFGVMYKTYQLLLMSKNISTDAVDAQIYKMPYLHEKVWGWRGNHLPTLKLLDRHYTRVLLVLTMRSLSFKRPVFSANPYHKNIILSLKSYIKQYQIKMTDCFKDPHTAMFTGHKGCGKSHLVLDLIE